jgi:hypothetical protein
MEAVQHTLPDLADQSGKVQPTYIPRPDPEEETALLSSLRAALGSCEITSVAISQLEAELEAFHQLHRALKGTLSELQQRIRLRQEAEGQRKDGDMPSIGTQVGQKDLLCRYVLRCCADTFKGVTKLVWSHLKVLCTSLACSHTVRQVRARRRAQ